MNGNQQMMRILASAFNKDSHTVEEVDHLLEDLFIIGETTVDTQGRLCLAREGRSYSEMGDISEVLQAIGAINDWFVTSSHLVMEV